MDEVDGGGHDTDNDDCLATAVVQTEEIWSTQISSVCIPAGRPGSGPASRG